jgi:hypothetical protein
MTDSKGKTPVDFYKNSAEDEPIIELVDEIGGSNMLDLEKNLLDLEKEIGRSLGEDLEEVAEKSDDIPELASIAWTDTDETVEAPQTGLSWPKTGADIGQPQPKMPDSDLADIDWILKDLNRVTSPGTDKVEEVLDSELSEVPAEDEEDQFLDAEEIMDDPEPAAAASEEDEALDLLDVDETDDQLIWFDDLETRSAPTEAAENLEADAFPPGPNDVELIMRTAGAPLRAESAPELQAPGESTRAVPEPVPPPPAAIPAAVLAAGGIIAADAAAKPAPDPVRLEISQEQIDAAVERLIEQKFAARIEGIIIQTIEKAVLKEIERLKSLIQRPEL